jgi:hypothetical protein
VSSPAGRGLGSGLVGELWRGPRVLTERTLWVACLRGLHSGRHRFWGRPFFSSPSRRDSSLASRRCGLNRVVAGVAKMIELAAGKCGPWNREKEERSGLVDR